MFFGRGRSLLLWFFWVFWVLPMVFHCVPGLPFVWFAFAFAFAFAFFSVAFASPPLFFPNFKSIKAKAKAKAKPKANAKAKAKAKAKSKMYRYHRPTMAIPRFFKIIYRDKPRKEKKAKTKKHKQKMTMFICNVCKKLKTGNEIKEIIAL